MSGLELAHRVKREWPNISVVIKSGRPLPDEIDLPRGAQFIQKPYFEDDIERIAKQAGC